MTKPKYVYGWNESRAEWTYSKLSRHWTNCPLYEVVRRLEGPDLSKEADNLSKLLGYANTAGLMCNVTAADAELIRKLDTPNGPALLKAWKIRNGKA